MSSEPSSPRPIAYSYVRFSRETQSRGDSLRRQKELSQSYAREHGLNLVEDFKLEDLAVSAFKGANIETGALGRFLKAVRKGEIERGSYLLIESLDRLSRQEVRKALPIFLDILNGGINVVTITDNCLYKADDLDEFQLFGSILVMSRAHEESKTKSKRLSAAWSNKRSRILERKLTARCPAWLQLSSDKRTFTPLPERVATIQRMFEDSASGIGSFTIARRLNEAKKPTFGRSRGWQKSYVEKILTNRAVLGEFQPRRLIGRDRPTEGQPITNYFPAIVSEELFLRSQHQRELRRLGGGGRRGQYISNLFSGLAECAYCRSPMIFLNKGPKPKGGTYLVCDAANRGLGCKKVAWRYDHFEASFLAFVKELDLEPLVRDNDESQQRTLLETEIAVLSGREAELTRKRTRLIELAYDDKTVLDSLREQLRQLQNNIDETVIELRAKEAELHQLRSEVSRFYESKEQIHALIATMSGKDHEEIYRLRAQIASRLKALLKHVLIAPIGNKVIDERANLGAAIANLPTKSGRRYFAAYFKSGGFRFALPTDDDPLQFDLQMYRVEGGYRYHLRDGTDWFMPANFD